ncbi:MAG TPA: MAPEG family protein [Rhizomicrobium sp.]|jgi:uncharacterized membrane protein YecN with MAPEG domain|nr:MAPEG family protein [Rhizomicrobium sp.]
MMSIAAPDMLYTALVTLLALVLYMYMIIRVGQVRGKCGIAAPAQTGDPMLERAIRVHLNTLEAMPVFLGSLWLAALYFGGYIPAILGAVWIIARIIYMQGYMADPKKRSVGFSIGAVAMILNLLLAFFGVISALMI